jgi:hypothetical protein
VAIAAAASGHLRFLGVSIKRTARVTGVNFSLRDSHSAGQDRIWAGSRFEKPLSFVAFGLLNPGAFF